MISYDEAAPIPEDAWKQLIVACIAREEAQLREEVAAAFAENRDTRPVQLHPRPTDFPWMMRVTTIDPSQERWYL